MKSFGFCLLIPSRCRLGNDFRGNSFYDFGYNLKHSGIINFVLLRTKINIVNAIPLMKNFRLLQFSLGKKTVFINSPRRNVNRKKLQSIWWNVKNYIFGTSND